MQHYGSNDARGCVAHRHVDHILKKYPELLISLNCVRSHDMIKKKFLRRETIRKKVRKLPALRIKQFESALFNAMVDNTNVKLFNCPLCRNVLDAPVTVDCGHTFCRDCLEGIITHQCGICNVDVGAESAVNVLVQNLVEKWRERNKTPEDPIPNTTQILGIQPRYHLRSGFAGLQLDEENKMIPPVVLRNPSNRRFSTSLKTVFKEVEEIKTEAIKSCWDAIAASDLECILCSMCILDPVTTTCGHTFCRGCLMRVLDHGLPCPLCMTRLNVKNYSRSTNVILDQAIRFLIPKEYKERLLVNYKEVRLSSTNSDIPVFLCTNAFPGVACPLFVYEARYRLLVRRCLLSPSRKFAMASKENPRESFASYGTILEVKDAVYLEDGSFILTTIGVKRFKVLSRGEQDGYDTAKIQVIKDVAVTADKLPELISLHQKVYDKASKWILSLTPNVLAEVERLIGQMPKVERNWLSLPDGPSWTWWLMPILPLSSHLQVGFLSTTNLEKRLRAIDKLLERMEVKMKALERNTCSEAEDSSESCSDSERTLGIPLNSN